MNQKIERLTNINFTNFLLQWLFRNVKIFIDILTQEFSNWVQTTVQPFWDSPDKESSGFTAPFWDACCVTFLVIKTESRGILTVLFHTELPSETMRRIYTTTTNRPTEPKPPSNSVSAIQRTFPSQI